MCATQSAADIMIAAIAAARQSTPTNIGGCPGAMSAGIGRDGESSAARQNEGKSVIAAARSVEWDLTLTDERATRTAISIRKARVISCFAPDALNSIYSSFCHSIS